MTSLTQNRVQQVSAEAGEFPFDAVLALVRWQQTRRGYDGDAALIATGLALLSPNENGNYDTHSLLTQAEIAFNVSWQRMAAEVMQFAVFLVTKAKGDNKTRPEQIKHGLRLLRLSLAVFASKQSGHTELPVSLSTNSCNLLLSAIADTIEATDENESDSDSNRLRILQDVKYIFVHLFGLPHDASIASATPNFQLYRPPTNVFADFMDRALSAIFKQMDALTSATNSCSSSDTSQPPQQMAEHVALTGAVISVYQELQRTQTNKRKVFLAVAKTSLRAILRFRYSIYKWTTSKLVDGAGLVLNRLDQTIEDALFDVEHIREFDSALVHQRLVWTRNEDQTMSHEEDAKKASSKAKKQRVSGHSSAKQSAHISYQKQLFDELLSILVDKDVPLELRACGVGEFMRVLIRGFSTRIRAAATSKIVDAKVDPKTSRKRTAIVIAAASTTYSPFKFWAELCAVAFLAFQQQSEDSNDASAGGNAASILVELYHSLFKALCEHDIYRVTEDTEEREQFATMEKVLSKFFASLPSDMNVMSTSDTSSYMKHIADLRCGIVSSAAECTPNLVDCCCSAILGILGAQSQSRAGGAAFERIDAESQAVVDLIQAYDSMRLLDKFLITVFAGHSGSASEFSGLYILLSQPVCEARLRKAFVALPPGQVDVLWSLFVKHVASFSSLSSPTSHEGEASAVKLGVVRLVFQMFMQEIHVTPQNRSKVVGLVSKTLNELVDPVADSIAHTGTNIVLSAYEREVCSIFGELLMFYNAAKAASATSSAFIGHFEAIFERIGGSSDRFVRVVKTLLLPSQQHKQQRKKESKAVKVHKTPAKDDGLSRAGVIKICVHWLQTAGKTDNKPQGGHEERIASFVIDYVVQTHCWNAVAFYLPELMARATSSGAHTLLRTLIDDYVAHAANSSRNPVAERVLFDAAFYEISRFREVAGAALASITKQFVSLIHGVRPSDAIDSIGLVASNLKPFFSFLVAIPEGYLPLSECGDLLAQVLNVHQELASVITSDNRRQMLEGTLAQVLLWLKVHFRPIAMAAFGNSRDKLPEEVVKGVLFLFEHDAIEAMDPHVIAEMLHFALTLDANSPDGGDADSFAGRLLRSHSALTERNTRVGRTAVTIQALALIHRNEPSLSMSKAEAEAIKNALVLLPICCDEQGAAYSGDPLALDLLSALVIHHAAISVTTGSRRKTSIAEDDEVFSGTRTALFAHIGQALASSMKVIASTSRPEASNVSDSAVWRFFDTCCEEYPLVRSAMTDALKGFGLLLAVAFSALGTWPSNHRTGLDDAGSHHLDKASAPLRSLMRGANKLEFRLVLATIRKEISSSEMPRKLAGLVALCDVVTGGQVDKKLSAARRQCIFEFKDALLAALVQNVSNLLRTLQTPTSTKDVKTEVASEVAVWNVRALMLLFCKPEVFTWKSPELMQSLMVFEMLYVAVSPLNVSHGQVFSLDQLHRIWTYSYTLLLRLVRHHFASVANCIPLVVQTSNTLLQVLISVSHRSSSANLEASTEWPLLVEWSSNLARLFGYMKEHDTQLRKYVVYLLMPFLVAATTGRLSVGLQQKLRPGVFALLDVCSATEKEQLYTALDSSGKSLLKTLDTSYKFTHRYVGKV